jgi:hypothetical protein
MPLTPEQKAELSKRRGLAAAYIADPEQRKFFIEQQGQAEAAAKKTEVPDETYAAMGQEADDTAATQGQNFSIMGKRPRNFRKPNAFFGE